ncbi:hypothetical protein GCM10011507_27240 [Edaphobacter acidisoli]|uniref:Rhamnogalacturonan endolyase n=1 Tax=Edaphobacter acidisoli TaxID=2040573 RepID=A0A916RWY5_9BACT|nr:polysaccharide lyase family protein [Edaphobacter acidisoli]GGA74381.1 hypothetical protein GCM10011507_27240 [Edaphobacter acidisoli]
MRPMQSFWLFGTALLFLCAAMPTHAQITIDTTNPVDWKISNGVVSLDWNSTDAHVFSVHLTGHTDELVDVTSTHNGQPNGLYMDNAGTGSGTNTAGYAFGPNNSYLDWWMTTASNAKNAFTYSQHYIITPGDSGFHVYFVANHSATDVKGSLGQVQYVFRLNLGLFTNTYSYNTGLYNPGASIVPLPSPDVLGNTDPGRQVQNAALDLHGLPVPAGYTRQFYTKYDYSSFEYFHRAHGVYGTTYAAWTVIPTLDSLVGGPTKQDLIFTDNLLMMECLSNHLDNDLGYTPAQGANSSRLFGPYYFHFNTFGGATNTPFALYRQSLASAEGFHHFYDHEQTLLDSGYVPSDQRGRVEIDADLSHHGDFDADDQGHGNSDPDNHGHEHHNWPQPAFAVLSDNQTNFQYTTVGHEYWTEVGNGDSQIKHVAPGTYRLSVYKLGEWGELRHDNIAVAPGDTTRLNEVKFTPENFSTAPPIWTIGTPDRSSHEFLHGHTPDGRDDRQYWGNWNYWADFAANNGAVIYYATPVGLTHATNDLSQWNYNQWQSFDPGLYAGIYNSADDTTDGYKYILPSYVSSPGAAAPPWQIHFTTTKDQQAQGQYAVLSVGLADTESSYIVTLNGHQLIWHGYNLKNSDASLRSGLSGTYQWVVFQWDAADLNPPGEDNVITFSVNHQAGVMYDALRMEITNKSADPAVTGWNDYEYLYNSTYTPANDAAQNQ